jgi:ABC-type antimicrobial peptide transport system permease subunit
VALTSSVPFYGFKSSGRARAGDDPDGEYIQPLYMSVSENYFELLSIPLLQGRAFTADEVRSGARVMLINQTMAATLFGEVDPLGRSVEVPVYRADSIFYDIIGVVADTRYDLTEAPEPTYFVPRGRDRSASRAIVLLETRPGANGQAILRSTIAEISPSLAPRRVESLEQALRDTTARPRMLARLLAILATVAAILAAVGLYGMVSTATAQRTFELGIRMALGSSPARILRLVLASTASVAGLGLAAGLLGAWALSRAVASRLYAVEPLDPISWLAAVLLLVAVTFVAALLPASRASRLNPVDTLRVR